MQGKQDMRKKPVSYAIILSVVALLYVLAVPSVRGAVMLSEKDTGSTVWILSGETLEVALKGNPTTGYMWEVASVDTTVLVRIGKAEFIPDRMARGAGGMIIVRFKAGKAGQTHLKLIYHRSFEKDIPPVKTFEVTVLVEE